MKPLQFTLTDLAWTLALLAFALAGMASVVRVCSGVLPRTGLGGIAEFCLIGSCPFWICVGLAAPFQRKLLGVKLAAIAYVAFFIGVPLMAYLLSGVQ